MLDRMTRPSTEKTAIDVVNAIVGVLLLLSPWFAGFTRDANAAANAWLVGAAIALIALGALIAFKVWEEWLNLLIGIWAILAPFVIGFTANTSATYAHVMAGLVVAILAGTKLWLVRAHPTAA